jgi:hypothetical protein
MKYYLGDQIKAHMGENRNTCNVLVVKPEGKTPVGRLRHRRDDSIKMELIEMEWEGMD